MFFKMSIRASFIVSREAREYPMIRYIGEFIRDCIFLTTIQGNKHRLTRVNLMSATFKQNHG